MSSNLVDIEGMDEVIAEFKKIDNDVLKRREILKLLRRQSKPLVKAIRSKAPVADRIVTRRTKSGDIAAIYKPGNLKKSIKIKTSRSKRYPNVLVGPNMGRRGKYDGYYAFFLQYGTRNMRGNDFIDKATSPLLPKLHTEMSQEMKDYIEKMIFKRTQI